MSSDVRFDRYYTHDELTEALQGLAAAHPELATLRSIGKSHQGRDVWLMEITDPSTGPGSEKPGYYLDGQIHAEEHATSMVALYAINHLLTGFGSDERVTRLLREQVFYVIPRINPDGAELSLVPPYYLWCGNGRYLPGFDRLAGLKTEDVDGDGFIVSMRVRDPKGEWKKSAIDDRLMVQREPGEAGGEYYRLYPEGVIEGYDGVHVAIEKPFDGNMNRNFPAGWDAREYGAGELPLSEPEAAAVARFILDHPNIAGMNSYHTHGGIILRPSMTLPDSAMSPKDLALYQALGKVGTRLTGYPTISIYEEFTPDKSAPRRGGLMDWTYEAMGIPSFATEVWDVETQAGVEKTAYYNLHPRTEEAQLKVFEWVLEHLGEQGFRPWRRFDHPQLGEVEVGGMVSIWTYRNPPPSMLEALCHDNVMFNLEHAAAAPRLRVETATAERVGADLYKVRAVVGNQGYLPTNLTDVAIERGVAKPVTVALELAGAELVMNPRAVDLGHLAGRSERAFPWSPWGPTWSPTTKAAEWLVRVPDPAAADVRVVATSQRAGRHEVPLAFEG